MPTNLFFYQLGPLDGRLLGGEGKKGWKEALTINVWWYPPPCHG
jgi:hypothetical protein